MAMMEREVKKIFTCADFKVGRVFFTKAGISSSKAKTSLSFDFINSIF